MHPLYNVAKDEEDIVLPNFNLKPKNEEGIFGHLG
jgi:hypothetical protein